jgi:ribonucleoside-diphosphate reductase alpha chain
MIDKKRDVLLTEFGKATLNNQYLLQGETYQDCFLRVSKAYSDNEEHASRMYDYISNLWFMPATPILTNGGSKRGLPISCYLNETEDSLEGISDLWAENIWLAAKGGGIGSYWGNLRSIGEQISQNGVTCGVIPFIKVMDSMTLAISQGSLRRGNAAAYMPIDHPEIEDFVDMRRPTGGDPNRKALNLHHGISIPDEFMRCVEANAEWDLKSPKSKAVIKKVSARALWIKILTARIETGEPYLLFIDHVNESRPQHHKDLNLFVKTSNLCSEITLPTGKDHLGFDRTAVCCLSSVNLQKYLEWENHPIFIEDCFRFLDNVLDDFINKAHPKMKNAKYAAMRERSVGLGVMGFHSFLQCLGIPFDSVLSKVWNKRIFKCLRSQADKASLKLGEEKGPCLDALDAGSKERFSHKIAIAPTASISTICGGTSPGIEPFVANAYTHKTLSGSFVVKNKHLEKLLESKKQNTEEVWSFILQSEGSVQDLPFLTQEEKDVFKTAFEIDQRWLIELASDRQPYICQAQSLNIFLPSDVLKKNLHFIHFQGWKMGLKSFYYLRSRSLQRAEKDKKVVDMTFTDECLSCQ